MASAKNLSMSPAATDLGLGDQLKTQMEDEEMMRKKKALQMQPALGPATQMLFGGVTNG